jgi:L-lactate dehydrogenase complex protein LldG
MTNTLNQRETNNEVRNSIMATIREHLAASLPFDAVHDEHHRPAEPPQSLPLIDPDRPVLSPAARFQESLESVGGHCIIVEDRAAAALELERIIAATKAQRVAVSDSHLVHDVIARLNTDAQILSNVDTPGHFDCDIGITGAQWGAAETGTLVLESDLERNRIASLVPPVHVALLPSGRVRQNLGEVFQALDALGRDGLSRTVTFITGPSRTSDIELTLAIGVHGPAVLYVIIIEGEENG